MLPTTLARGRATARGYGELLTMLNPAAAAAAAVAASGSIPGLSTYRYSPYTIPNAAGSAAAAAALSAVATTQQTSVLNPVVSVAVSQTSQPAGPAAAGAPHAVMHQSAQHQQPPCTTSTAGLLNAAAVAAAAQQQLNLQQIQFLGLAAGPAVTQQQQPSPVQSVSVCGSNSQHLAAQILALNNQAVAAAAAAAAANAGTGKQQRAGLLNDSSSNPTNQANFNGLNYSMNDLINLQGLQQAFDASAAANFQVPVGL